MEAAEQFERIINDSGFVRLRRLSTDEIVGTDGKAGLIERSFSLMPEGDATLQDIDLAAREMRDVYKRQVMFRDNLMTTGQAKTKGLYLFWTMVDGREKNGLYDLYELSLIHI